jgi:NADPH:quinone reductase-like Zn-dependent oxidoreductase
LYPRCGISPSLTSANAHKVIAYDENSPIHSSLVEKFAVARFDAVVDAVGIQDVFNACPEYLAEKKPYVTVGPRQSSYTVLGMVSTLGAMVKNLLWPKRFGGVPRQYVQVAAVASLDGMQEVARMVGAGRVSVHVGATFKMANAVEVSCQLIRISQLICCRPTTVCSVVTPEVR